MVIRVSGVRDYTCGYRAYRVGLIRCAGVYWKERLIQQSGFGCMVELLIKLKPFNPIVREVPLILRYDRKLGESKMKIARTIKQTLGLVGRSIFKRF